MSDDSYRLDENAQSGGEFFSSTSEEGANQETVESAFPDEDEETITMLDVIERENKLEEEASAVLGNSDEKNCTYPKGYIPRQALYSCVTCSEGSDAQAAICLACSLECHDNHEVYELYTKRNYRCDCGNSKFKPSFECKLLEKHQQKLALNEDNKYNHNFSGRYCTCDKRYPPDEIDSSPETNDEMWQCIVCEDWYHTKHLGAKELPKRFDELICKQCVDTLDFVHYYEQSDQSDNDLKTVITSPRNSDSVCKLEESVMPNSSQSENSKPCVKDESSNSTVPPISENLENQVNTSEADTNDSQVENKDPIQDSKHSDAKTNCILDDLKKKYHQKRSQESSSSSTLPETSRGPLFWQDYRWRSNLCRCDKCLNMYKLKGCEYLLDEKDTVQYYEAQGKALAKNNGSPVERGMSALNRMNRAAVVEALHGYDELKADLSDYLRKFADTKKVVREEDIHEFFQQLKSKKRPKLDY